MIKSILKLLSFCTLIFTISCTRSPTQPASNDINGDWIVAKSDYFEMLTFISISNSNQMISWFGGPPDTSQLTKYEDNCYYSSSHQGLLFLYCNNDTLMLELGHIYNPTNDGNNIIGSHWTTSYSSDTFYMPSDSFVNTDGDTIIYHSSDSTQIYRYNSNLTYDMTLIYKIWVYNNKLYQIFFSGAYGNNPQDTARVILVRN